VSYEEIVRLLAACEAPVQDGTYANGHDWCVLCSGEGPKPEDHDAECPWRLAREAVKPEQPPTRYARVARARNLRPDSGEVMAYLPANYQVIHTDDYSVMIAGQDHAGWTLDGYVIPRLASGLISAEEWTAARMEAFLGTAGRSEADKIAEIAAGRDDGRF
jgi:hypothetical protein